MELIFDSGRSPSLADSGVKKGFENRKCVNPTESHFEGETSKPNKRRYIISLYIFMSTYV